MPACNRAFCIRRSIDSFLGQTIGGSELVIVDDGSTDGTESLIADEYAAELERGAIVFVKSEHAGVSKARNAGLALANGEWIAYLDPGNEIVPEFAEEMARAIDAHPEADAFYSKLAFMASGRIIGRPFDLEALRLHNFIDIGTYVHRCGLCASDGVFDESMTSLADWELMLRYSLRHAPVFIDKVLLRHEDPEEMDATANAGPSGYYASLNYVRRKHCPGYPLVTTVITAYNHEKYIDEAISSAIAQEGRFIHEILVSDDCSRDGTRGIVREYAEKNPGLVFDISGGANLGISGNMRKCFERAKGKYIAVLEGDDYWTCSSKLAAQVDFLEANADCSMVFSRTRLLQNGKERLLQQQGGLPRKLTGRDFFDAGTVSLIINFSCCMFRADLLRDIPEVLYENRLSEIALAFYMETLGYIGFMPEVYSVYRVHSSGAWSGASHIGKRLQERFCREVSRIVCRPEYKADFALQISKIDSGILVRERDLEAKLKAAQKKCDEDVRKLSAAVRATVDCRKEKTKLLSDANRMAASLERKLEAPECALKALADEVAALKSSESYRIGMFMTWPLRRLLGAIKRPRRGFARQPPPR
ncbi:MAG: glycosyltransferase family 2 protein [Kiritimatiellae bacterium]|nr:glycosyltransferase family 2 protein [Kiritimatiellia bacterium]